MRRMLFLSSASVLLGLGACTGAVEADSIELEPYTAPVLAALPSWEHQPEAAPEPLDPRTQPHLEVALFDRRDDPELSDLYCNYRVITHGFPAIDSRGQTMVHAESHVDGNSDGEDEYMLLSWLAPEQATREQYVFERADDFAWDEGDMKERCESARRELRQRVDELNAELKAHDWRPLERLDVLTPDASMMWEDDLPSSEAIEALPLDQRPVEILYRGQDVIARVRAARVIDKQARPGWQTDDYACTRNPHISKVQADRETGVALITYDHSSGGCLCDDHVYVAALRMPAELFAEIDRRPSAVLTNDSED